MVLLLSQLPTAGRGSVVTGWIFVNKREKGGGASVDTEVKLRKMPTCFQG